jgi:hypothetical protein
MAPADNQVHSDVPASKTKTKEKKWVCIRVSESNPGQTCYKSFARKADLQRHEGCVHDKHKMERIDCPYKKCGRKAENGFLRRDHLTEHMRHFHNRDIPKKHRRSVSQIDVEEEEVKGIDCPDKKCGRRAENGFLRRDHLTEHMRHFHNSDIPKKHRRSVSQIDVEEDEEAQQPEVQHFFN